MANFNKCMAEEFDSTKVYSINDMVTYNNMLYKCTKQDYTAQEFSTDNFELTYLTDVLGMGNVIDDNIAPLYNNTLTYTVGDYVMYNRYLYVCNTNIETGEDFDSTKWDQCYITDLFESNVNSNLNIENFIKSENFLEFIGGNGRPAFTALHDGFMIVNCTNNVQTGGSGSTSIKINNIEVASSTDSKGCIAIFKKDDVISCSSSNSSQTGWGGAYFKDKN